MAKRQHLKTAESFLSQGLQFASKLTSSTFLPAGLLTTVRHLATTTDSSTKKGSKGQSAPFKPFYGKLDDFGNDDKKDDMKETKKVHVSLVEMYNSHHLLSRMDQHKLELERVRESFRVHEDDCGSSQVQIALLTEKIKYMAQHMQVHRKDYHSRKGLEGMLAKRRKLLKYLRRTDWDSYCVLLPKLGLRDRAEIKG